MDMRQKFPSRYYKPEDFTGDVRLTMASVHDELIFAEQRPVLYFRGQEKGLVINGARNKSLIDLFGYESNQWVGQDVVLFATTTMVGNKAKPTIGVKKPNGQPIAAPKPTPNYSERTTKDEIEDEIPF